jgi:penicillin-binding protein 2
LRDIGSRVTWLLGVLAVALLAMGFQLYRLTVVQSAFWRDQAEQNMLRVLPSYGARGVIYDRKGRPLATSEPAFAALLVDQEPTHVEKFLPELAELLAEGDEEQAQEIMTTVRSRIDKNNTQWRRFEPIVIKRISKQTYAKFTERRAEFPGVETVVDSTRDYPQKSLAGALLGYVGPITEEMLKEQEFAEYNGDEVVGKDGLERYWEHELRGKPGSKSLIVDWLGKPVQDFKSTPPQPGHDLVLTLDADLQKVAEEALVKQMAYMTGLHDPHSKPLRGALVAVDVRTGAVLAMASVPTYDPNIMVKGITETQWQALQNQPGYPLVNGAIVGFAPGSTYKMATGLAGLQLGKLGLNEQIKCPAAIEFGGRFWKNWTGYDQGPADISRALAISCNPFFWEVGQRVGMDQLAAFNAQFGFGKPTGIDLWGESAGNLPTKASYGERYREGDDLNVAIGQGDVLVTPLQLAGYMATIANSGVVHRPYLVQEVKDENGTVLMAHTPIVDGTVQADPQNWSAIQHGLYRGSHDPDGTAYWPFLEFPISTGGKTGSAEFGGYPHALSVAYAPFDKPEIAVAVIVQGGGTGSWTTPVIRRVMARYFGIKDVIPAGVPTYAN